MSTTILYIRVSTDEQASHGFSQEAQKEILLRYCSLLNIEVKEIVYEDYSAKTFNRPAWNKLFARLRQHRSERPDLLLFTRWDRFSRNAADAYQMIAALRKLQIEPQAVEQILDLAVPENKITLAFYLVAPEVENDRRSLNVKMGLYKGRKDGRCMSKAPVGYVNRTSVEGQKYIVAQEPYASILQASFEQIALHHFSFNDAYKIATEKGLRCSRSNFYNILRNPIYCGKIRVGKSRNQDMVTVKGKHEGIISEEIFDSVQKKKQTKIKSIKSLSITVFPFKGFILCPNCNKKLTASTSRGRSKQYSYYHCSNGACRYRIRADELHQLFLTELHSLVPIPFYGQLFKQICQMAIADYKSLHTAKLKQAIQDIERTEVDATVARQLLLTKEINGSDYAVIRSEIESKIRILQIKLNESLKNSTHVQDKIEHYVMLFRSPDLLFELLDVERKRKLIRWLLPECLTFKGSFIPWFNVAVKMIYKLPFSDLDAINETPEMKTKNSLERREITRIMEKSPHVPTFDAQIIYSALKELTSIIVDQ